MSSQLATVIEAPIRYGDAELASMAEQIERYAWQDLIAAAPSWLRHSAQLVAEEIDGALLLASRGISNLLLNRVIGLGEQQPASDRQVSEIMDRYSSLGVPNYWVHTSPHARPVRLGCLLQQHGLKPYRRSWVKMMRPARRAAMAPSELRVRRACMADAHHVASVLGPAFDLPQQAAELFTHVIDREGWDVFVAELHGEAIAVAGLFACGEVAYLAFAATREQYQRRGAQRALMQALINCATDRGHRWIATETGFPLTADEPNSSYHNMLWAGFRPVEIRDNYAPLGVQWSRVACKGLSV